MILFSTWKSRVTAECRIRIRVFRMTGDENDQIVDCENNLTECNEI